MGNTVFSHVLYACGKLDLDLENFFSSSGNAHKIYDLNYTELKAAHCIENPDPTTQCILQLRSDDWFYVLQHKMMYHKWFNSTPSLSNLEKFFKIVPAIIDTTTPWEEYYDTVRDPSWPDCKSFSEIDTLPEFIQHEIRDSYQLTNRAVEAKFNLVEFLTQTYYDMLIPPYHPVFDAPVYKLSDYFAKKIQALEHMSDRLGWKWNQSRSDVFHLAMLQANKDHLSWLEYIKKTHHNIVNSIQSSVELEEWERAWVIAKVCETLGRHPQELLWQDTDCFLEQDNITLIKSLQGKYHGKTI